MLRWSRRLATSKIWPVFDALDAVLVTTESICIWLMAIIELAFPSAGDKLPLLSTYMFSICSEVLRFACNQLIVSISVLRVSRLKGYNIRLIWILDPMG